jgi:hypothetical protein
MATGICELPRPRAELAEQISQAVREHTGASQTLANAMQNIANITEESSVSSRETARAVSDLAQLTSRLTETIARFRIGSPGDFGDAAGAEDDPSHAVRELSARLSRLVAQLEGYRADGCSRHPSPAPSVVLRALARDVNGLAAELGREPQERKNPARRSPT